MSSFSNLHKLVSRVRGGDPGNYAENRDSEQSHVNSNGDKLQSFALPPRAELVRLGDSYQVLFAAATGLTAVPTTAGLGTLWNGEPGNGRSLVIDSVACFRPIIDVTTADNATIWAQIIRPPVTAPTDAALTIRSLSGRYSYGGRVRTVATSTTLANRWEAIGNMAGWPAIAGTAWNAVDIPLLGRYVIPPGASFTITASEITATASAFRFAIRWHEIQQPLVSS